MGEETVFCDCSTFTFSKRRPLHKDYVPLLFNIKSTLQRKKKTADRRLIKEVYLNKKIKDIED